MKLANTTDIFTATAFSAHYKEVVTMMHADLESGLSIQEVEKRLKQYGPNSLKEKEKVSPVLIFLQQFKSPFVLLLALAAGLSFYFEEYLDGFAIVVVIVINAIIGFIMEFQAEPFPAPAAASK